MISFATLALAAAEETHGAAESSGGLLQDTSFWVLIAFAIVIGVFVRAGIHKSIAGGLDKRAQNIADEINEARKMREEAQELLAAYQRQQRDAEEEAAAIIEQAKVDAQRLAAEAHEKIDEQMKRRAKAAEEKIARAEAQALSEVRANTAELAVEAARKIIKERMDQGAQTAFVDRAIADLRNKLN